MSGEAFASPNQRMTNQRELLNPMNVTDSPVKAVAGLRYQRELVSQREENVLLAKVGQLPFKNFEFHGFQGKRRTVSFGWQYEFSGRGQLRRASDIPEFLLPLRMRAAAFAGLEAEVLEHVLVIEYGAGAGIGWHRDRPVFGDVIGVSLLAACELRFRRKMADRKWQRASLYAEPRSVYFLTGTARTVWEHSILRVDELRYSVTFRRLRHDQLEVDSLK